MSETAVEFVAPLTDEQLLERAKAKYGETTVWGEVKEVSWCGPADFVEGHCHRATIRFHDGRKLNVFVPAKAEPKKAKKEA